MRVVHVCGDLGLYGAENVVALLLRHTSEPDVDLVGLTVNRSEHPEASERVGVPVVAIDRAGRHDVGFLFRMIREFRRLRPDVVHTHGHHGRYWGRLAAVLAGVPVIVHTEHNSDLIPPHPRALFTALNRILNPRTNAFIAFTAVQREQVAKAEAMPVDRVAVIPNGVPPLEPDAGRRKRVRASLDLAPDSIAIVAVARLFPLKRQDLAIDAFAALPDALRAQVRLILVGDGPMRAALETQAAARGLRDTVQFLGFRADARDVLAAADVALLTSLREAMPLSIIEAMLESVPIVSTPWAGADAMLGGGRYGTIASDFTTAAVTEALRATIEDRPAAERRAADALAYATVDFDVRTQARRYTALYRSLVAQPHPAEHIVSGARR
ncbi:MAG: glycosyltransferase [Candidatus Eremiobacteraeota bacterium]|nr:glycosyltransferase [Candidatus Eremiobacteraeota bacterium]